ncbi:hypothetical protein Pcinc_017023 [Petrolisthes cinctipes]|uniref:Uncharacterized protein n=1 Tax=Petrolisthes cinctipes TaxID=88211 RepID=A0AAE1KQG8_PETCI|nr:hypothetical protein Pcinc_017023 [Petrolisthes cinctipes]
MAVHGLNARLATLPQKLHEARPTKQMHGLDTGIGYHLQESYKTLLDTHPPTSNQEWVNLSTIQIEVSLD